MSDISMLQPPGALLRYLMTGWSEGRRFEMVAKLAISQSDFDNILLGARPIEDNQFHLIAALTGIPEATFRGLEHDFTEWCATLGLPSEQQQPYNQQVYTPDFSRHYSGLEVRRRVAAIALEMSNLLGQKVLMVPILKGAFIFAADLIRYLFALSIDAQVEFMELRSYNEERSRLKVMESGVPLAPESFWDRTVVIVDDICDTGETLNFAKQRIGSLGAKKILTCVLFNKYEKRADHLQELKLDYVGFNTTPGWMVGFGMDDQERLRGSLEVGEMAAPRRRR